MFSIRQSIVPILLKGQKMESIDLKILKCFEFSNCKWTTVSFEPSEMLKIEIVMRRTRTT